MIAVDHGRMGADCSRMSTERGNGGSAQVAGHIRQATNQIKMVADILQNRFDKCTRNAISPVTPHSLTLWRIHPYLSCQEGDWGSKAEAAGTEMLPQNGWQLSKPTYNWSAKGISNR